jgi:RNA polymerase sigma-70 factor (ECF subfamily)
VDRVDGSDDSKESSEDSLRHFVRWYGAEHARLFGSLVALSGDRELAAEATDEALSRALQHWERVRAMDSPEGWTYRVAVNVMRRLARRRNMERRVLGRLARGATVVASQPAPGDEVWDLVRALPERQRTAVVLRYVADLAEADVAAAMSVTRGTVASTLAAARRALADVLAEPDVVEEPS